MTGKYICSLFLSLIFAFTFVSCFENDEFHVFEDNEPYTSEKTVIVYMIADNTLDGQVNSDLNEMERGWNNRYDGRLIAYVDRKGESPYIREIKSDETSKIVSPEVLKYDEQNSCSLTVMEKVLSDIKRMYPSKSYGLILWSHADGWRPVSNAPSARSFGEDGTNGMEISELGKLSGKYDFIIFDACDMSGIEAVYELRHCTEYIVASVVEILSEGFPYNRIINHLFKKNTDLVSAAQEFMSYYRGQSSTEMQSAAISIVSTGKLDALAAATKPIIQKYKANISNIDISKVQKYDKDLILFDFKDFIETIAANDSALQNFYDALSAAVIFEDHTPYMFKGYKSDEFAVERSCGLNCYIPGMHPKFDDAYEKTAWYKAVYSGKLK